MIHLKLKSKHFEKSKYLDNFDCPIARVVKEHFSATHVSVGLTKVFIYGNDMLKRNALKFTMSEYGVEEYINDAKMKSKDPEMLIRTITLIPCNDSKEVT